jgi:hypothetical protein
MKYIINYMLFMVICAVISVCFRYVTEPLNGKGSVVGDPTTTDYWGIWASLSPNGTDYTVPEEETTIDTLAYTKQANVIGISYSRLNDIVTNPRINHYTSNNFTVRATTLPGNTMVSTQSPLFHYLHLKM